MDDDDDNNNNENSDNNNDNDNNNNNNNTPAPRHSPAQRPPGQNHVHPRTFREGTYPYVVIHTFHQTYVFPFCYVYSFTLLLLIIPLW